MHFKSNESKNTREERKICSEVQENTLQVNFQSSLHPFFQQRMAAVKLWLEMEIGITGGEEVSVFISPVFYCVMIQNSIYVCGR